MTCSIGELSKRSGVSIRALRHYDAIGLLRPSAIAASGYRYYDDAAIERLWQILFYRELGFPLGEIAAILDAPGFDCARALHAHKTLLEHKRAHLDGLIALVLQAIEKNEKGERYMEFTPFDTGKIDELRARYAEEAKARWGGTEAYRESMRREAGYTKEDRARMQAEAEAIFRGFAALAGTDPASDCVQALVTRWQAYISASYYECTDEILADLGQMYVSDERFSESIDRYGAGTAKLMSEAIAAYCASRA